MARPRHARVDDARRGTRRTLTFWVVLVLGIGLVLIAAAFVVDGIRLLGSKDALTQHAAAAKTALLDRDATALSAEVVELETAAQTFAGATSGPHWWIAAHLPWVKDQAVPLMAAGEAVDAVAREALAPLAGLGSLDALEAPAFEDGRIDPDTLEPYRETLAQAAKALDAQQTTLADVDIAGTIDAVAGPFVELREQLETVGGIVQGGHVAAELLPTMLGGDEPRTYLVMVQNNAEPRTTGGIPGAVIEVTVEDGRMTQGRYASASSMVVPDGVGGLTDDELRIFSERMEIYPHDVNFTPEYPRSAELMTRFWAAEFDEVVDGVLSVDPVALGWMLEGASPTELAGFTITSDNLADVMLNQAYFAFEDPAEQDAFFARASAELFGRIVSGETNVLGGVERAIEAGRFMIWSADGGEQELLATTPAAGAFLERDDALGVFLNDGSGSKIGYYVDTTTTVTNHLCTDGSLAGQTIAVALTHTYDGDVADLPEYISGGDVYVPAGEFHANLLVYPRGGTGVTKVTEDGAQAGLNPEQQEGRTVGTVRVVLEPGQSVTYTFEIAASQAGLLPPVYVDTPGPKPNVYEAATDRVAEGC
ncbi:DUF4012 domain-containing protein [Demequina sp. SYSU T00039]|uniref:DUF4012 domain-containing protein n=1 Tax=Demequina lignilytica TaxID=3051663 RepID=A0AAW7M9C5_9MICO|nr:MULTISPECIES: DUF4012 domain-containing protein [unclassified Demequina]MDN4477433.1 DUF4012 domain-containing protein [Demequina sp. SYSU T00039-1]MDN4488216.1 DUF4012 domain-containing protein [Demequina sp. SYSU T00039]